MGTLKGVIEPCLDRTKNLGDCKGNINIQQFAKPSNSTYARYGREIQNVIYVLSCAQCTGESHLAKVQCL